VASKAGVIVGAVGNGIILISVGLDYALNPLVITFNSTALIDLEDDTAVYMIDGTSQVWDWQRGEPIDLPSGHRLVMTPDGAIGSVTPFRTADLSDELAAALQHLQSLGERPEPPPPWEERADHEEDRPATGRVEIAVPGQRQGVLEAGAVDPIGVTLSRPAAVIATLRSPFFDTILELYDDQGRLIDANDDYDGTDSRLILDLPAGTYQFRVKSYWDDGAGAYTLEADYYQPPPAVVVDVTAPGVRSGFLAEDAIDTYRLTLPLPATVTVDLASKEFDTYLEALDAFGMLIDANDDYHDTDSRLVLTLEAGTYMFKASSFWPSESGAYTISFGW